MVKQKRFPKKGITRKGFLKLTGLMSLSSLVISSSEKFLKSAHSTEAKRRLGMVIDLERCILCRSCTIACKQENKTPPEMLYNPVLEEETGQYPNVNRKWFPRPCMHCQKPACLEVCPVKAIKKREDGIVYIDPEICKGIQACIGACPYGVPLFDKGEKYHRGKGACNEIASPELGLMQKPAKRIFAGKARKCSFCLHKQDENGNYIELPACAKTCMGKAIYFGDLNDPSGELQTLLRTREHIRLKEEAGTEPNVYYLTSRR